MDITNPGGSAVGSYRWCRGGLVAVVTIVTGLLLFVGLAGQLHAAGLTYGTLHFEKSTHDFGEVFRGSQLTQTFRFVNKGPGPLTIQGVHAACNCTAVEVDRGRRYEPGQSGTIEVTLDTSDFVGNLVKTVTVISNERLLPDRTLTIRARVKSEIFADPPLLDFASIKPKTGESRTVRIRSAPGQQLEIKGLDFNDKVLTAQVTRDKDDWILTAQLLPEVAPGFLKDSIVVRNNSQHLPKLTIPVRGQVMSNFELAPSYLEFGSLGTTEGAQRTVTLRGSDTYKIVSMRGDMQINGQKVDQVASLLKLESVPPQNDLQQINVELKNASTRAGSVRGKIYIETTDPVQPELSVDFYALFR